MVLVIVYTYICAQHKAHFIPLAKILKIDDITVIKSVDVVQAM